MADYKRPDVFVEEVSTLPPSVAGVSTGIPAFIGFTEQAKKEGKQVGGTAVRITTFLEYKEIFGGPAPTPFNVNVNEGGLDVTKKEEDVDKYQLYYALDLFFKNGGSDCYIISIGNYNSEYSYEGPEGDPMNDKQAFLAGLETLKKEDEPTLIVLGEATRLDPTDYYDVCKEALAQCADLKDRFCIFDVLDDDHEAQGFRNGVGTNDLKYGAAYMPYLQTSINYAYKDSEVKVKGLPTEEVRAKFTWISDLDGIKISYKGSDADSPKINIIKDGTLTESIPDGPITFEVEDDTLTISKIVDGENDTPDSIKEAWDRENFQGKFGIEVAGAGTKAVNATSEKSLGTGVYYFDVGEGNGLSVTYEGPVEDQPKLLITQGWDNTSFAIDSDDEGGKVLTIGLDGTAGIKANDIITAWGSFQDPKDDFNIEKVGEGNDVIQEQTVASLTPHATTSNVILEKVKTTNTTAYSAIQREMAKQRVILPASSAVAGIYSKTDRERGVWKAPANVSLSAVIGPTRKITAKEQEALNIDSNAGKSINAIRSFSGKGTLVWGARTLMGNDNEWRYVPVRRLFNMIEESTKKATYFAVFEPNDATTWLKVKGMIDSYLRGLWQQGALAGSSEDQAYFVNIGLGKTMTQQDILEGRMIVEIGVAAVRPAEFIVLRFSHKLQEA